MKTRFVLSMCAVGALLATQGLVGCGSDGNGSNNGTGGVKSTGGAVSTGGVTSAGGSGGGTTTPPGTGGSTTPRDAGLDGSRDAQQNRDTQNRDTSQNADVACGGEGEACCANNTCDNGLTCQGRPGNRSCETAPVLDGGARLDGARSDTATACGGDGEPCCADDTCDDGLTCQGNRTPTCRAPAVDGGGQNDAPADSAPCGGEGEACCSNSTCDDGLTCQGRPGNRSCEAAADGGGPSGG
jgi:hypothetical protein